MTLFCMLSSSSPKWHLLASNYPKEMEQDFQASMSLGDYEIYEGTRPELEAYCQQNRIPSPSTLPTSFLPPTLIWMFVLKYS